MIQYLRDNSVFVSAVIYPVIPLGLCMFRMIPTTAHSLEDVDTTVEIFKKMKEEINLDLTMGEVDLKKIAKRLNVPVIIAAQRNRDVAKAGRKPKLSDLRESGSIEQDSDVVLMIHPKKEVEEDPSAAFQVEVDMMVEKHRNGATFHCPCTFNKVESRFNNKTVGGM